MRPARYLGIDYGDQRVGLALGQAESIALPYKVLLNESFDALVREIKAIVKQEDIAGVVVGLPKSLSGAHNERYQITLDFVEKLRANIGVELHTVDEQFTTAMYRRLGVKNNIDKYAAAAILDTFLKYHDKHLV